MAEKNAKGETKVEAMHEVLVRMPDSSHFEGDVEVTNVLVGSGDVVNTYQTLITVESDIGPMEIPSTAAGTVGEMKVKVGDKVSKGVPILTILKGEPATQAARKWLIKALDAVHKKKLQASEAATMVATNAEGENKVGAMHEVLMPDTFGSKDVEVAKVLVNPGDVVNKDQTPAKETPAVAAPRTLTTGALAAAAVAPPAPVAPARAAAAPIHVPVTPANRAALKWLKKEKANDAFYRKPQTPTQPQSGPRDPFKGRELHLEFIAGSFRGRASRPIGETPAVRLTAGGRPVARAQIVFTVPQGDDLGNGATTARAPTNALGIAKLASWTLGAAGAHSISAEYRFLREERTVIVST